MLLSPAECRQNCRTVADLGMCGLGTHEAMSSADLAADLMHSICLASKRVVSRYLAGKAFARLQVVFTSRSCAANKGRSPARFAERKRDTSCCNPLSQTLLPCCCTCPPLVLEVVAIVPRASQLSWCGTEERRKRKGFRR